MIKILYKTTSTLLVILHAAAVNAGQSISVKNLSPLIGQLPQVTFPKLEQYSKGSTRYDIHASTANYISSNNVDGVQYTIDGETSVVTQSIFYGLSNEAHIGISVPWYHHAGGVMDQHIYDFHDTFGMPQNGRSPTVRDQLKWTIQEGGNDIYSLEHNANGIGDIELFTQWRSNKNGPFFRATLHLPSGSFKNRLSTKSKGLSLSAADSSTTLIDGLHYLQSLSFIFGAGITAYEAHDAFNKTSLKPVVFAGMTGISFRLRQWWDINAQLNTHSPYTSSNIREIGWTPIIFSIATDFSWKEQSISLGFSEDLRPSTSPDFSVFIAWNKQLN